MSHKLLTVLGKAVKGDYRNANYQFDDDCITSSYFGLALNKKINADNIIVLGTSGSMWDNFFLQLDGRDNFESEILQLTEFAQQDKVSQSMLDDLIGKINTYNDNKYQCKLISYAKTEAEQLDFIQQVLDLCDERDKVTLDVTHGLRHLPLLVQQVAQLLPLIKNVKIEGIYYGALDLTQDNTTPVMDLNGLLLINEWKKAFNIYEVYRDMNAFTDVLEKTLPNDSTHKEIINNIKKASFYNQTHSTEKEIFAIRTFLKIINDKKETLPPVFNLFLPRLRKELNWVDEKGLWQQKGKLAKTALKNNRYINAALFGFEAIELRLCEHLKVSQFQFNDRKENLMNYLNQDEECYKKIRIKYHLLRRMRNFIAHGKDEDTPQFIIDLMENEDKLRRELLSTIDSLLNKPLP
ncbi:CRISPR-associated protein, TM1812 family [Phocoenobacter uteri]|uniref:CRISPR-associated protein, TM1812 family n=1 Tax=Phocoenobacter uteri TaxID=146806 RepID=A0A379C7X6_9PAST|nr:TIGR02221 family CRISPR-associated protein [Phocoenobacter uteri]MDG6882240.1 hypothetical protein [Phocoenobacter uteri]SUB58393.1 CRISPR-associated protein, TM1812 family [Phocoenobacter uteri]